jgi:hypothetical protein
MQLSPFIKRFYTLCDHNLQTKKKESNVRRHNVVDAQVIAFHAPKL